MEGIRIPFKQIYGDITLARKKIYAVVEGHLPGLYDSWAGPGGAEEQVGDERRGRAREARRELQRDAEGGGAHVLRHEHQRLAKKEEW